MSNSYENFRSLLDEQQGLSRRLEFRMRAAFPVGAWVQWRHGTQCRGGEVVRYGFGLRILVRNPNTSKEQWIYAERFTS